jgi:hypothetical protein
VVNPDNVGVLAPSGEERTDAGDLLPFLLRWAGAPAVDRKGKTGGTITWVLRG